MNYKDLVKECKKRGIDPKSGNTPKNIKEAMQKFFYDGEKFPNFMSLENENVNDLKKLQQESDKLLLHSDDVFTDSIYFIVFNRKSNNIKS